MLGEKINSEYEKLLAKRLAQLHTLLYSNISESIENHFVRVVVDMKKAALCYGFGNLLPIIKAVEDMSVAFPKQLIHGDLHVKNMVFHQGNVYFIDFDSATLSHAILDVAFAAFRCLNAIPSKMDQFVSSYNTSCPPFQISRKYIWHFLIYAVLQRILFICTRWMTDMDNQLRYLDTLFMHLENSYGKL